MKQKSLSELEIKDLAKQLNINDIVEEANRIGNKKKPKLKFEYQAVYSTMNRIKSAINPVLAEAIINLAEAKSKAMLQILEK